ncbi:hypothetical protein SAMN05421819_3934 [Bryocella elongata]|uniref:Uncharacterized protein n=1 Tax=Bryocella elongata TaxID=863522 RepID=A0A1H6BQR7_9BACT|nr:hypothetical protein [Bryocella elongata]SEG62972.1 hypothetical protein SAMN05421819_3934 [Bryocella elongata]
MQQFAEHLVTQSNPEIQALIDGIVTHHKFALDLGGKMQHQWLETCGLVFGEYLYKWLREGNIEFVAGKLHQQHKKHLTTKLGFPFSTRHEGTFIEVAAEAFPHILVGQDIDFWEPTEKGCSSERRLEIMAAGSGAVCRYLDRKLGVRVVTVDQAIPLVCHG